MASFATHLEAALDGTRLEVDRLLAPGLEELPAVHLDRDDRAAAEEVLHDALGLVAVVAGDFQQPLGLAALGNIANDGNLWVQVGN